MLKCWNPVYVQMFNPNSKMLNCSNVSRFKFHCSLDLLKRDHVIVEDGLEISSCNGKFHRFCFLSKWEYLCDEHNDYLGHTQVQGQSRAGSGKHPSGGRSCSSLKWKWMEQALTRKYSLYVMVVIIIIVMTILMIC